MKGTRGNIQAFTLVNANQQYLVLRETFNRRGLGIINPNAAAVLLFSFQSGNPNAGIPLQPNEKRSDNSGTVVTDAIWVWSATAGAIVITEEDISDEPTAEEILQDGLSAILSQLETMTRTISAAGVLKK